jgi:hypothetical protein
MINVENQFKYNNKTCWKKKKKKNILFFAQKSVKIGKKKGTFWAKFHF